MDAASAMILASRLHEVEGVRQSLPIDARLSRYQLPPPADQTEQDERVNAYWAALVLHKCWSPILGHMPILTNIGLEAGSADAGQLLNQSQLQYVPYVDQDPLKLQAKAAAIHCSPTQMNDATAYLLGSADLDARIVQFQQTLQPLNNVHPSRQDLISRLLHVHILINCATIQLQKPLNVRANGMPMDSRTFMAAHAAANVLNQVNIGALTFVDSSIGFLLVSVADVLASALRLFGLDPATSMSHNPREQRIVVALSQIRYALTTWGERNAYIKAQLHLLLRILAIT
ncbi:hypothetical protein EVJ58_g10483 [Rhodofomes roseus]|uniref:Transcription factor domain-containing protein n=1 Tax=Rhodofomes roseus TaxID=34475 RepID=A0A4Y9XPC1_9APHY|nr:hypothetical protein EVJ58_g10483 [Rhodofomes roseus]